MKKIFKIFIKYILPTIVVIFIVISYIIYNPPAFIVNLVREQAEIQILKATDLYAKIEKISTLRISLFRQTAVAEGITIHKNNTTNSPNFLASDKLEIKFNLLSYLLFGPEKSTLTLNIIKPVVDMKRDKNGKFDIDSPLFKPSEKKEQKESEIPKIIFYLQDGHFKYQDQTFANTLKVDATIPVVNAELQNSEYVKFNAKLNEMKDVIDVNGTLHTRSGQGTVDSNIHIDDFSRWINVFIKSTKGSFVLRKGTFDFNIKGSWDNYKLANLKFNTNVDAKDLIGKFPYYNSPVSLESLKLYLDQNKVDIKNLKINSMGTSLTATSTSVYNGDSTYIKASVRAEQLMIANLLKSVDKKFIPDAVRKLDLGGTAKADIDIDGAFPKLNKQLAFFTYPETFELKKVKGKMEIDDAGAMGTKIEKISTKIDLDSNDAKISDFYVKGYQGTLTANINAKKIFKGKIGALDQKNALISGEVKADKISINNIIDDFNINVPKEYKPFTRVNANVKMNGTIDNPKVEGKISTPVINFDPKYSKLRPIRNVYVDLGYAKDAIVASTNLNSADFGKTAVDLSMKKFDAISVKAKTNNFQLSTISNFVDAVDIRSGNLNGTASAAFSLNKIKNAGKLDLKKISYLVDAKTDLDFNNGNISYKSKKSPVSFTGTQGNIFVDMGNGDISSKAYLNSNETGNVNALLNLKDADALNAKVNTVNFPLKKIEPFVPNLYVIKGNATLNSDVSTRLSAFEGNLTPERILGALITDTSLKLSNTTLKYNTGKTPVSLTDANGTLNLNNNGQDVTSVVRLSSKEYGNNSLDVNIDNLNATNARINVSNVPMALLTNYVPNLRSSTGKIGLTANVNTNIKSFRSGMSLEQMLALLDTKAYMNLSNSNIRYALTGNKVVSSTGTNAKAFLSMRNGLIGTDLTLNSKEFGHTTALVSVKNMNSTNAKININQIPTKTIEAFVPNLKVNSGSGDVNINLSTNIKDFKSGLSLDQMTYLVDTDTSINFKNNYLRYGGAGKKPINIDNGLVDINIKLNNGILDSEYLFSSNQFGKLKGFLDVDKSRKVAGRLTNDRIDLTNINNFLPSGKIRNGIGVFDISTAGNLRDFTDNPAAITVKGFFDVNGLTGEYKSNDRTYLADVQTFHDSFSYTKGNFVNDLKVRSDDFGNANVGLTVNPDFDINGKIYSTSLNLGKINKFVDTKPLIINNGFTNINLALKGNLGNILNNNYDFYANGTVSLDDLRTVYVDEDTKVKVKKDDNTTVEQNRQIPQNLEQFKVAFDWKSGIMNINQILLKNGSSSMSGKGLVDINKLTKNPDARFGSVNIKSDNFDMKDFPIRELAGIQDAQVKELSLDAQLSKNIKNLAFNLNTDIRNLSFTNEAQIDSVLAKVNLKNNIVTLNKVALNKGENYLNADGTVNIANTKNPKFALNLNSRNFPIKSIFSLVPEAVLKRTTAKTVNEADEDKTVKVTYKLPVKNTFVTQTKQINVNNLINYWEEWSLEPLTPEDKTGVEGLPPYWKSIDGDLSLSANLKGDLLEPKADIDMMVSNADIYGRKLNEIFVKASYDNGEIDLPDFHFIENEGGYLTMNGNMSDSGKVNLEADGKLNLNWAKNFMKSIDTQGETVLSLDVKGTTTNPNVNVSLDSDRGGVFNNVYFDNLSLIASYKDKILSLADARITSGGREAKASGIVPIDESLGSMNVSLGLTGESMGLVNLFTNQVEWLRGQGDAFVNVQGSISDPLINGNLNINNAEIYVAALNKPLEKINVDIAVSNHFVKINRADAFLNDGKVSVLGQVDLIGYRPGFLKLKLFADDFRWEQDNINLAAKVGLMINNTIDNPLIGGKVQLTRGEYTLALGGSGSSSSSKSGATIKSKKKTKPSFDAQFNNLQIEIPKDTDFWARSAFFDLRPYGSLKLESGSIYSPEITGFASIDKGSLYLINNEFNIVEARADFGGKDFEKDIFPINPRLNVVADTKLTNPRTKASVDVEAKITGELADIPKNNVQISWTKTGGLTESEIWTQVVGLDAAQQLVSDTSSGSANTLAQFATPYFNRAIFNPLTSKVADFLSLEEFNVGLASDAISNPGVSVSIAKPIIGGLSLGYQGTIRSANLAQYLFFTRYRFNNGLSVRASVDERNAAGLQGEYGFGF